MQKAFTRKYPVHYIGIDPSLTSTGIAMVMDIDGEIATIANTLKPPKGMKGVQRLHNICAQILSWVSQNADGPVNCACYEKASLYSTGKQIELAELRGVIRVALFSMKYDTYGIEPARLKKFGAGNGQASKNAMIAAAKKSGWDVENDDEADAAHLAWLAYAIKRNQRVKLTRTQMEVLKGLEITL